MIYIRTDANEIIATGHVMRCLTIAEEIVNLDESVCFVVSDKESLPLIREGGFEYIITNSRWNNVNVEAEYEMLRAYISDNDILLADSYYIKNDYLKRFKSICKVATFDDMFDEEKEADIVINYNLFYKRFDYTNRYKSRECKLLLGGRYVPLRKQFRTVQPKEEVRDYVHPQILLMCGGGDARNFICTCLEFIDRKNNKLFKGIEWKVVVGNYYPHLEELKLFSDEKNNVEILQNVKNMAEIMNKSDICITAASTVLYECCAMLLPTLFAVVADDQRYDAEFFSKNDVMIYCGNFIEAPASTLKNVQDALQDVILSPTEKEKMKNKMYDLVDGKGAMRIAKALIEVERRKK